MFKFDTALSRLRSIGIFEAISFLLLLGIAMPLKYAFDQPEMVRIVGMAHGVLWVLYVGLAVLGQIDYKWPLKTTLLLLVASMLPFGPIIADAKLLKKIEDKQKQPLRLRPNDKSAD
jgi:integral membrane protein